MSQRNIIDAELLTEHLGYAPISLLDSIINNVNAVADKTLDRVEQGLSRAPPKALGFEKALKQKKKKPSAGEPQANIEETAKLEIIDGVHKLETLLCAAIDKNFDMYELYVMQNILGIQPSHRNWMRLAHYDGLDFTAGAHEDAPTRESVEALRQKLQASQRLNVMLHAEQAKNAALLTKLKDLVGGKPPGTRTSLGAAEVKVESADDRAPFQFLHNKGDLTEGDAKTPITTTTAFNLSQLQALRALSTSLRNIMPDLKDPSSMEEGPEKNKSWRRERLEYVEGETRKHLETVRGLELGKDGEVRDGEWQGEGRKFAKGEVEGLESVVAALGGGVGGSGEQADPDAMDES
ncbi:mind kinetochore complex component [Colletotrichum truncatum]|uniref:Mind kinetochore complex component n=1 Tax=Colletotrichum truncatum TaxID=5467 RepID=A0ACC3YJ52_COLTU|nr:mind kinetochore complex component [Colletotrichum truncatum]KAF6797181.1 mind kinetochore complex component [Colletotrichum truncatum]